MPVHVWCMHHVLTTVPFTPASQVHADVACVCVPLGVLKAGLPAFCPPLPSPKAAAIQRLGFGLIVKVADLP